MNPRAAINDLHPFQGCPFGLLGTSPSEQNLLFYISSSGAFLSVPQRREWDSNPRALADKRFSRPPRYDHFDISPCIAFNRHSSTAKIILPKKPFYVNYFFQIFSKKFENFFNHPNVPGKPRFYHMSGRRKPSAVIRSSGVVIFIFSYEDITNFTFLSVISSTTPASSVTVIFFCRRLSH